MPCNNCGNLDATRDKISLGADNQLCRCHQNNTPSNFIEERVKDYNTKFRKYLRPGQISTFDAVLIANEFEVYLVKSLELQRQKFVEAIVQYEKTKDEHPEPSEVEWVCDDMLKIIKSL